MMGGDDGGAVRPGQPDVGGGGDGGTGVRADVEADMESDVLPFGVHYDGLSIAERRAGALLALANEPQGARRFILSLAYATGQPIGDIERLRLHEGLYLAGLVNKRHG